MTCIKESSRSRNGRKSRQGSARKKHRQQQKRRLHGDSLCTASGNLARTATLQAKLIMTFIWQLVSAARIYRIPNRFCCLTISRTDRFAISSAIPNW